MDEHTKKLITMLNDMYYSQGDEYKSRYRDNYFELLRHLISPRAYISGAEISAQIDRTLRRMNKE
jgi:hypothetical protein